MIRKPSWYAVAFVSLLIATVIVPALAHIHRAQRDAAHPHTLEEAAERIRAVHPGWSIVAAREDGNVANGFYVVQSSSLDVRGLTRYLSRTHLWRGVVFVSLSRSIDTTDDTFERGRLIGDYFLYGDQALYPVVGNDLGVIPSP